MSGKKQHFIPKHFLKEFVVPDGNDKLWMFRRDSAKPIAVSISNAAAMRYFYSKPTNSNISTLDDVITNYEDQLKSYVEDVRAIHKGEIIPPQLISEIAAHLMIRAKYVREITVLCLSAAMTSIGDLAHPSGPIYKGLETNPHRVPSKFEDGIVKNYKTHHIVQSTNISPKTLARIIYFRLRENPCILKDLIEQIITSLQSKKKDISREIHIETLQGDLVPVTWKTRLKKLYWRVIEYPTANAVLPDCIVIAKDRTGWLPYFIANTDTVTQVVLPLASDRLAVGCMDQNQNVVVDMYNHAAQKCCFEFYLSNNPNEASNEDNTKVGDNMRSWVGDMATSALRMQLIDFFGDTPKDTGSNPPVATRADLITRSNFPYILNFDDFVDRDFKKDVGDQLNCIISMFVSSYPMHSLHGFSFVKDYTLFLQKLNQDDDVNQTFAGDKADNIGIPILVEQENRVKTHLILSLETAKYLISSNEAEKLPAMLAVINGLSSVAFNTLIDGKFPGKLLDTTGCQYEDFLYQYNQALISSCFFNFLLGARKEDIEVFADHALKKLEEMVTKTLDAHNECISNCNRQQYFKKSAYHVSSFLFSFARFVGATACTDGSRMSNSALGERLSQLQLSQWFELFEKDLLTFYRNIDEWARWEDIYFINWHFERILFDVGIITEELTCGSLGVFVFNRHLLSDNADVVL